MRKIEAFYSRRKDAKIVRVVDMDEFLSISGDHDDEVIGATATVSAQGNVLIQRDIPIQATMLI